MNRVSLDAFQLLIAVYLFYVSIKGSGTLYNFPEIPKDKKGSVRGQLRKLYAAAGCVALLDGMVSMLQNSMFTVDYTENEAVVTQNFTIGSMPFITYEFLSTASFVCSVIFVLLLVSVIFLIKKSR